MTRQLAKARGMSVLMVTHDSRILDLADRIIEMEDGRILRETRREEPAGGPHGGAPEAAANHVMETAA